jgi:choline dehydrogenase-like flavoprotein
MSDFRGVPGDPEHPLAGIIELGAASELILEAKVYSLSLGIRGAKLKEFMRQSPLRDRLMGLTMQAEDAPQLANRVDLDPQVKDVYGLPVPRVTYKNHAFELSAREFYTPKLIELVKSAGAQFGFVAPYDTPPQSSHIMGTLRMGDDPRASVCDAFGKLHDLENTYCADGAVFVSSSGFNPTLTLQALALRMAGNIISPNSAERAIRN